MKMMLDTFVVYLDVNMSGLFSKSNKKRFFVYYSFITN